MAKKLIDLELSGFVLPHGIPELTRERCYPEGQDDPAHEGRYDFNTFIYDVFFDQPSRRIKVVCPPLMNFRGLFDAITFEIDGEEVQPLEIHDLSRCSTFAFETTSKDPRVLTIRHQLFGGSVPIGRSFVDDFAGLNAMYSLSKDNSLEWIQDWLTFNVRMHGANAVILADNNSTRYEPAALRAAIEEVDGIECAAILRARYPFGPTSLNYQSALFLQRAMMELFGKGFSNKPVP